MGVSFCNFFPHLPAGKAGIPQIECAQILADGVFDYAPPQRDLDCEDAWRPPDFRRDKLWQCVVRGEN
jgi:hypothetical protein